MRLISWNVNGRVAGLSDQSQALHQRHPDIVALQEVVPTTAARWQEQLAYRGLPYSVDSFALQRVVLPGRRDGGNTARCWPVAGPCLRSHLRPFLCHGLSASYPLS
jgi:hypothetical protein